MLKLYGISDDIFQIFFSEKHVGTYVTENRGFGSEKKTGWVTKAVIGLAYIIRIHTVRTPNLWQIL